MHWNQFVYGKVIFSRPGRSQGLLYKHLCYSLVNKFIDSHPTLSQVAPSWCLHCSTCQFWNGIPKPRSLSCNSQVTLAAKNCGIPHEKCWCWMVWKFGQTSLFVRSHSGLRTVDCRLIPVYTCWAPCSRMQATAQSPVAAPQTPTDLYTALTVTVTVTVVRLTIVTVIVAMQAYF